MRCRLAPPLALAILVALAGPAAAQADRSPGAPAKSKQEPAPLATPMVFYLAKGEPGACGEGCSEWIAAEGEFDLGAAQRLRSFLARAGGRKPPIFFHSPGGLQATAIAIGRLLRDREMTAGVSLTMPAGCVGASEAACRALKQSGQKLAADLHSLSNCFSSCAYALIGAKVRRVPPGARLGVHSSRLVRLLADGRVRFPTESDASSRGKASLAHFTAEVRPYLQEMRMDARLFELIAKVPFEQVRILSRDEIAGFGIDTREFQETRWTAVDLPPQPFSILKFVLEAKGAGRKEYRTSMIQLVCAERRVRIAYFRGLGSDEMATRTIKLAVEDRSIVFPGMGSISKIDAIDTGGSFDLRLQYGTLEFLDAAAARDHVDVIEAGPTASAPPSSTLRLSTAGLARALRALRQRCDIAT